jgi:hypothetical protein
MEILNWFHGIFFILKKKKMILKQKFDKQLDPDTKVAFKFIGGKKSSMKPVATNAKQHK